MKNATAVTAVLTTKPLTSSSVSGHSPSEHSRSAQQEAGPERVAGVEREHRFARAEGGSLDLGDDRWMTADRRALVDDPRLEDRIDERAMPERLPDREPPRARRTARRADVPDP